MEAFVRMYNAGLIYRGNRIVNWDPKGQTTISDDEIVYEERKAKLYTLNIVKTSLSLLPPLVLKLKLVIQLLQYTLMMNATKNLLVKNMM
jgi:hypothetical protein